MTLRERIGSWFQDNDVPYFSERLAQAVEDCLGSSRTRLSLATEQRLQRAIADYRAVCPKEP